MKPTMQPPVKRLILTLSFSALCLGAWAQTGRQAAGDLLIAADISRTANLAVDLPGTTPTPTESDANKPVLPPLTASRPGIVLIPGDVIAVNVADEPGITGQYTVREDGKIIFPEIGEIMVQGMTPTAVADSIADKLRKFVVNPVVAVQPISMLPRVITVIGGVGRPGAYDMRQFPSLLALLVSVGGFEPGVDLSQAMLLRKGEVSRLAMQPGTGSIAVPKDISLLPGDTFIIPAQGASLVSLTGAVTKTGVLPLSVAETATRAIVMSGGPTPTADLAAAYILRDGKHVPLYLDGFLGRGPLPADAKEVKLQAGDIIVVPSKEDNLVYVTGEAKTQGPQPLEKAGTVSQAITLAGGLSDTANGAEAYVLRKGQRIPVDLKALLSSGQSANDLPMEAGDVIIVPKLVRMIFVAGQVAKPGAYSLDMADTLLAAISSAGPLADDANLEAAVLLRDNKPIPFDANALLNKADTTQNLALQPGDKIVIPRILDKVYAMGAVGKTGPMPIQKGDTLIDILGKAGGVAPNAQIHNIVIARRPTDAEMREIERKVRANRAARLKQPGADAAKEQPIPDNEKLPAELLADEIAKENVRLYDLTRVQAGADVYMARPGDVIYVPAKEEKESFWRGTIISFISSMISNALFWHR